MAENEINTVHVLIRRFLYEIDDVIKDKDASHKWLVSFAKTLQFQDLCKTPNEYALTLLREAKEFCLSQRKKSQIKQVRKILADEGNASPTKEQIETRWAELYGNDTTADGDTREDSQDIATSGNGSVTESGTSANLYGEAATSDGADVSTTFSNNMRRVPQNEAPAHGFSGGRTAQGTMSRSPEAAAQSGKVYDQETYPVSTGEARQSRRTDGHSLRVGNVARTPVRSGRKFRNKEEYMQWAIDSGLDAQDASDCWEATLERGGKDKDGNKVNNIKAFATQWCKTSKKNRETA